MLQSAGGAADPGPPGPLGARCRWLADGLELAGLAARSVVVLCCEGHRADQEVAVGAGRLLGADVHLVPPPRWDRPALDELGRILETPVVLACAEGEAAWRRSGGRARIVGEGPGAHWWRLVELQGRRWGRDHAGDVRC